MMDSSDKAKIKGGGGWCEARKLALGKRDYGVLWEQNVIYLKWQP